MSYAAKYINFRYSPWTGDSPHPKIKIDKQYEADVLEGICNGLCMDWLRRLFHLKAEESMSRAVAKADFAGAEEVKLLKRFGRQVQAQRLIDAIAEKEDKEDPGGKKILEIVASMGVDIDKNKDEVRCMVLAVAAKENFKLFQKQWGEKFPAQKKSYNALKIINDTAHPVRWPSVLTLKYDKVQNVYIKSFDRAVTALKAGQAALILLGYKSAGHAMAIYKETDDASSCHVLDPNEGWYKLPNERLLAFLQDAILEYHKAETIEHICFLPLAKRS